MKERAADEERKRQKELERQRGEDSGKKSTFAKLKAFFSSEVQRLHQQQEHDKVVEARQRKAKEKQQRREEWLRKKSIEEAQATKEKGGVCLCL